jgi:tRNA dimethylallyltransferase
MADDDTIYVLTGPTAVGKTELSLCWAEAFDAEIVSCDSLLFYRGMDIGTAKPSKSERDRVPHHLIDIAEVNEPIDIRRYLELAEAAIADIRARSKRVLVCGGSGFYLRSFYQPVVDSVEIPVTVRRTVARRLQTEGLESLVQELEQLNPGGIEELDTMNPRRVVRALERCLVSGLTLAELKEAMLGQSNSLVDSRKVAVRLERTPDDLNNRIHRRIQAMLDEGLVEEVRKLMSRGLRSNPSAARAVGYRETMECLLRGGSAEGLAESIGVSTCRLVRKQRSWFRNQMTECGVVVLQEDGSIAPSELFEFDSLGDTMAMP